MTAKEFEKGILDYKDHLFRAARCITRCDADAEDAVCEAIVKAYTHLDALKYRRAFHAWMLKITIRESYRICRLRGGETPLSDADALPGAHDGYEEDGLLCYVNLLPEELRLPVLLFYFEGMHTSEIADLLKIPEGTVSSRLNRARTRLRVMIPMEGKSYAI